MSITVWDKRQGHPQLWERRQNHSQTSASIVERGLPTDTSVAVMEGKIVLITRMYLTLILVYVNNDKNLPIWIDTVNFPQILVPIATRLWMEVMPR